MYFKIQGTYFKICALYFSPFQTSDKQQLTKAFYFAVNFWFSVVCRNAQLLRKFCRALQEAQKIIFHTT